MSGDASVEVSVPTDLTVTSDGDSEEGHFASRRHARELQALAAERAELQRVVEKQKLEIQSRDSQIAALSAQHKAAVSNVLSQKDNDISARQIHINRLEAELLRAKEELSTIRERAARELVQLTQKCAVFQQNQKRLTVRQEEIRSSLSNLQLSEEEFVRLRATPVQQLTLQQYTSLRVYELVWPLRLKVKELEAVNSSLDSMLHNKDDDLQARSEQCLKLQKDVDELRQKCQQYSSQLVDLKDEQRTDDFKVRNFNRVKSERDMFEEEKISLARKVSEMELLIATLKKERNILEERYNEVKIKARKQESDLSQNLNDVTSLRTKLDKVTEELDSASKNLRFERDRYEELHVKYVSARGDVTSLAENNQDLQHEIKLLKEKHHSCTVECRNLQDRIHQLSAKNEELISEVEKYKVKYDTEVKVVESEMKELRQSYASLSKTRDNLVSDNAKFHQEVQALEISLHKEKLLREKETSALREELKKCKQSLAEYQALDKEYEKNIRVAASLPDDQVGSSMERLLPCHSLARNKAVEQSVQLTRRILMLERQNTEAANTIQQLTEALEQLSSKVSSYKTALGLAGQPSSTLLQHIASLDDQISTLQAALQFNSVSKGTLEEENKRLTREISKLQQSLNNLTVLNSELNAIKQQLQIIKQSLPPGVGSHSSPRRSDSDLPDVNIREGEMDPRSSARAIIITKNVRGRQLS